MFFLVKFLKSWRCDNLFHSNAIITTLWPHDYIFDNTFILSRLRAVNFVGIIKILTMFMKPIFKDSEKLELCIEMQSIYLFVDITKNANYCWKNAGVSRVKSRVMWFICFKSTLGKVWLCQVSSLQDRCDRF